MPYIKVNPGVINIASETLQNTVRKIDSLIEDLVYVSNRLEWEGGSASEIRGRIRDIEREIAVEKAYLKRYQEYTVLAAQKYGELIESVTDDVEGQKYAGSRKDRANSSFAADEEVKKK